jgi:lysophospholipid acyltransferase (LPLAT)-like uncharacterized protein
LLKRLSRSRPVQETLGFLLASYLGLVRRTNRFVWEPADGYARLEGVAPIIGAMWHGQHFMIPYVGRTGDRVASLVSRSADGEFNAVALRHLGIRAIRGSGDRGRGKAREKGGAPALRAMVRALDDGESVVLTADVPKISRVCGAGIVTLARLSGRPVVPLAVVTSRRIDFRSWDRASLGLPFGRGAIVIGEPVFVAPDADESALETARRAVERGLDLAHERAYAIVGAADPGAKSRLTQESGSAA